MSIANISLHISLPLCNSLKEKRNIIKPLFLKVRRKFNVSIAEMGSNDKWHSAILSVVMVSNSSLYIQSEAQKIINYIQDTFQEIEIINHKIEML